MALIVDETFASGIPGGFATARAQAGALTATYNAGAAAVDLSNATAGQNIWDITSVALAAAGETEIDLEFVSNAAGTLAFGGIWAVASAAVVSNGFSFAHNSTNYEAKSWTGATSWAGNSAADNFAQAGAFAFATAGDRRTFNLRWDMSAGVGGTHAAAEFRIDGNLILRSLVPYTSLRPGVCLYQSTVRLHSIKVWDAPQASISQISGHGLSAPVSRRVLAPPQVAAGKPGGRTFPLRSKSDIYFGGTGRIQGTVKEKGTPDHALSRRVFLHDEKTKLLVADQWSNASTGAYSFEQVSMMRTYTVISYDYAGTYRAVVADNQIPEAMP